MYAHLPTANAIEYMTNCTLFDRTYTRRNCEMECESKIYDKYCNCVLYYLPRTRKDITICAGADEPCIQSVTRLIASKTNSSLMCDCLPSCYALHYTSEISSAPILNQASHSHVEYTSNVLERYPIGDLAIVHIFFKEFSFRSQIKEELIGFTEFLCKSCDSKSNFCHLYVLSFYSQRIRVGCWDSSWASVWFRSSN